MQSGPRPDVASTRPKVRWKVRIAKVSARLSHGAILGLIALAMLPHVRNANRWTVATAAIVPPPSVTAPIAKAAIAEVKSTAAPAASLPPQRPAVSEQADHARPATPATAERSLAATVPLASKDLPLIVARASVLPAPAFITASLAPIKSVQAVALRKRDSIATLPPPRNSLKVTEGDTLLIAGNNPVAERTVVAAIPREKPVDPPAASDIPIPPPHIGVVKKSSVYTVVNAWTDEQIADAKSVCSKLLKSPDIIATEAPPEREGSCGAPAPVDVRQVGAPKVQIHPSALLTCPMAAALNTWMTDKVQPAAIATFGQPVARLISASSYSCRNRYGAANTPLSEHALINALDLSGFVLADGRTIRVLQDWGPVARDAATRVAEAQSAKPNPKSETKTDAKPDTRAVVTVAIDTSKAPIKAGLSMLGGKTLTKPVAAKDEKPAASPADEVRIPDANAKDQKAQSTEKAAEKDFNTRRSEFLHRVHDDACDVFGTVLGPEANDAHRNHFHLDMKARRHKAFCQ